jgi:hypothetical protein
MAISGKYFRHRLYSRIRHARKLPSFLTDVAGVLDSTASAKTVTPKRTTNTKAEALVVMGSQPANGATLTIGNFTYTFKTTLTEVKASKTLTNDGTDVTALDTVTIGGQVYTFKSALTEVKATGTLTNDGSNVTDGDTVTIDGVVYTFQSSLTNVAGHIKIGASNTATMTNLFHGINASGGTAGTDYAAANVAHTTVVATNPSGTTVVLTAKTAGTAGNAIATTEASTHLSFGAATLAGGVAAVANEVLRGVSATASMTALYEAINAGANVGVDYSTGTVANAYVTATNPTASTVVATAILPGTAGNAIAISESSSHLSWAGAATVLSGGVAAVAYEVLRGADAAASLANIIKAINDSGTEGTHYSTGTLVHDKVVASAATNDLLLTAADVANVIPGMSVALSKSSAALTLPTLAQLDGPLWTATAHGFNDGEGPVRLTNSGGALPTGSITTDLYVHVVDTNTIALATSLEALRKGNFIRTTSDGTGTHSVTRTVTDAGIFDTLKRNKPRTVEAATDIDSLV